MIPSFEIYSSDGTHEAAYAVTLTNAITIDSGQGQGATTSFSPADVSITIDVTNPCKTTTVSNIVFDPTTLAVYDGQTGTSDFDIPGDGVDTANLLTGLCGTKVYAIADNSDGSAISNWATIADSPTDGKMRLTITPGSYGSHIASDITITVRVTTTYTTWTSNSGSQSTIAVTLKTVTCDCSALAFTAPTITTATVNVDASSTPTVPAPTADTTARSSNPAFNTCYETSNDCATTGTYAASSIVYDDNSANGTTLPSWITWNDST